MRLAAKAVTSSIRIQATGRRVWTEVTDVDLSTFGEPPWLRLLGIPKPIRAEIRGRHRGGRRVAHFADGSTFEQEILTWEPGRTYSFSFKPSSNFRVLYAFRLATGPLSVESGTYEINDTPECLNLRLTTRYHMNGTLGSLAAIPARAVLLRFQKYLLEGIRRNAEAPHASP